MPSPEIDRETQKLIEKAEDMRANYQEMAKNPALADFTRWLEALERDARTIGNSEMDNLARKALYLQSASVYGTVAAYLRERCSSDTNP